MTPPRPLVSVLIPVRDGVRYLKETIDSVMGQDWRPLEVIVVDDGSTDGSADVAEGFGPPVRCVRRRPSGLASARNAAAALASGAFLLHLDADDLLTPGSIALRMAEFAEDPALELAAGRFEAFFSPDLDAETRSRLRLQEGDAAGHLSGTAIVRADAFARVGPLNERWRAGADLDWFARAEEAGLRVRRLPDIVLRRRIHGKNLTLTHRDDSRERLGIVKAALDRRRARTASKS